MAQKHFRVLLADPDRTQSLRIEEMLSHAEHANFQLHTANSLVAALDALTYHSFDVALIDMSLPGAKGLDSLQTIQRHAPGLPVVLLADLGSEVTALAALERGAQDYLVKGNLNAGALSRVLQYAVVRSQKASDAAQEGPVKAAVVGLLGAKGGVGVTTVACHYAVELQRQTGTRVLLMDLDMNSASAAFLMQAESKYSILDACTNLHRLDDGFWRGIVHSSPQGIDLIQAPGAVRSEGQLDGDRLRHVLRFARSAYSWIVVDLGRSSATSLSLLEETGRLFVVTTPELASLYEASRLLKKLADMGPAQERAFLLLNRLTGGLGLSAGDVEKALGYPVHAALTESGRELNDAYAGGRFLDTNLELRKQIRQLVAKSLGLEVRAPRGWGLKLLQFARTGSMV